MSSRNNNNGVGPCGACKFLRRKCVKGCIFAPYFDSEEGAAHFAAVHKVFGASNASKLLHQIPASKRLDAVVTLCYEAFARVRDPVYGCVAHLFSLQQQVVKLQAELACIQARISTMQLPSPQQAADYYSQITVPSSDNIGSNNSNCSNRVQFHDQLHQQFSSSPSSQLDPPLEFNEDLRAAARDFVCRYLPGVRVKPPASPGQ